MLAIDTPTAFHVRSSYPTWILDYGANDHTIGKLSLFSSPITPYSQTVCLTDGSTTQIRSKGIVHLSPHITLSSILHVPNFAINLLSVSRLKTSYMCCYILTRLLPLTRPDFKENFW